MSNAFILQNEQDFCSFCKMKIKKKRKINLT